MSPSTTTRTWGRVVPVRSSSKRVLVGLVLAVIAIAAVGLAQTMPPPAKAPAITIDNPTDYDARANLMWCATNALNGLIGAGVPQDWTTHMLGHELTAMFGIDHAKTLAILQPAVWTVRKEQKRAKLVQYAERVWDLTAGDEDSRIEQAIAKTRDFFEGLGVSTRLGSYGVTADKIDALIAALEQHQMTALGETQDVTLEVSRRILETAM